jgi:hypothetical protein
MLGCERALPLTAEERLKQAVSELASAASKQDRFYALADAAKQSFVVGREADAQRYATELLALAQTLPRDWNYGNAIHDGNMVLGRVAAKAGKDDLAKSYLAKAGSTPGSPQLNTFGPNMSLAQDLLRRGQAEAVLEYFQQCRRFWEMHEGQLDEWATQVKAGKDPEFGANVHY